jgi:hypothetical protein
MKAIETQWKGYRFRSRLEARWAVFADAWGIGWEYEPEGYETPYGPYLPDFHMLGWWFEVKPVFPSKEEIGKLESVVFQTLMPGAFLGPVPDPESLDRCIVPEGWGIWPVRLPNAQGADSDTDYWFAECVQCAKKGFVYGGWPDRLGCSCEVLPFDSNSQSIAKALEAARAARWEHGETP